MKSSLSPEIRKVVKYGVEVSADLEMDELRRERCLCLNCGDIESCQAAKQLFEICKINNMALAVTRCLSWVQKETS